jgi:hypothetical protein
MEHEVLRGELGRKRKRHVPLRVAQRERPLRRELGHERPPELTPCPRYEQEARSRADRIGTSVVQRCFTRESAQQTPCSSGSAGSYSSVTW